MACFFIMEPNCFVCKFFFLNKKQPAKLPLHCDECDKNQRPTIGQHTHIQPFEIKKLLPTFRVIFIFFHLMFLKIEIDILHACFENCVNLLNYKAAKLISKLNSICTSTYIKYLKTNNMYIYAFSKHLHICFSFTFLNMFFHLKFCIQQNTLEYFLLQQVLSPVNMLYIYCISFSLA